MDAAGLHGCCVATEIYNLGNAHGVSPAKDLEDFANRLDRVGLNSINITTCNSGQTDEKEWLQACGFKLVLSNDTNNDDYWDDYDDDVGGGGSGHEVYVFVGNYDDIKKAIKPIVEKRREEEKKKREEAEAKRKAEIEKRQKVLDEQGYVKITAADVKAALRGREAKYDTTFNYVSKEFDIKDMTRWHKNYYTDSQIATAINSRLTKRILDKYYVKE